MKAKQIVGQAAAKYVKDGMILGLGTGSTAYYFVAELGRMVKEEGLKVTGVATSNRTADQARELGIPLKSVDEVDRIDLTVDGADEFDPQLNGIKGGGGALLIEKIVATYSDQVIWITDDSKKVNQLGAFPLPVEVIKEGSQQLYQLFADRGYQPSIRLDEAGNKYRTDNDNYIIDLALEKIDNPDQLAQELINLVGVVEHGLFIDICQRVIYADNGGHIVELER
ncbi:ribose-5-phosphate isomerase [Aerococcus urinaehominis]|uniref:Ribose-5-phosphate isomerase A n=1 Tax=Aerococcus urinaehominis TaxID=128944 RepID=A0A109RGH1_9LACT|nr:ribose-5-phosphate isomerase RpiA [Aerococcus urinaehominis]AMB98676.1 ribose-5-phosphate isomerase [Aerococcus urinaehominis]SDL98217.1 ribose-5-phosphate isomerase [Aerococcus urinaehominis]